MTVDISLLKENGVMDIETSIDVIVPPEYNLAEFTVKVFIKGKMSLSKDIYVFEADAKAAVKFRCDSCLSTVVKGIEFHLFERFSKDLPEDDIDNEIWAFSEHSIDLENIIKLGLISNMPMKVICSDGCSGLCPKCGHNLNEGTCDCDNTNYDPRFEVLRSLFNETEV